MGREFFRRRFFICIEAGSRSIQVPCLNDTDPKYLGCATLFSQAISRELDRCHQRGGKWEYSYDHNKGRDQVFRDSLVTFQILQEMDQPLICKSETRLPNIPWHILVFFFGIFNTCENFCGKDLNVYETKVFYIKYLELESHMHWPEFNVQL